MTSRTTPLAMLLIALLATPLGAQTRHWTVAIADATRPGRVVTADVLGPATAAAPCPVAVIGHATLTTCDHYAYLATPLAEAGWLVALPTTEGGMPGDQQALADDMLLVARSLRDGDDALPPGIPAASNGAFALLGHSLGGGAAVLAAAAATDVGALALLAPQERPRPSMIQRAPLVTAPTLIVTGELDCVTPPLEHHWPLFAALGSNAKALSELHGGGHCAFAGTPEPCTAAEADCPSLLEPAVQQAQTGALVGPWLHWQLCGEPAAGAIFLAAAQAPGVSTDLAGLPTAVIASTNTRLIALGPSAGGGNSRWALEMPAAGSVSAAVFDLRGMLVRRVLSGPVGAGRHELTWNGRDTSGRPVAAGIYLLRVEASRQVLRSRVVRLD